MDTPGTVAALVNELARQTGAPLDFVDGVRDMLASKGIALDGPPGPFFDALVETFHREEAIRIHAARAHENLAVISSRLAFLRETAKTYLAQLTLLRDEMGRTAEALAARHAPRVRPLDDDGPGPIVPGPAELQ